MRTFVIGDIHGGYKALLQCFERAKFDYRNDKLIALGDVCDGWSQTKECVDELLKLKNLIFIMGNHDWWAYDYMTRGARPDIWTSQGGDSTIKSYRDGFPASHVKLFATAPYYYIDDEERLFIHGGFDRKKELRLQSRDVFMWDRTLMRQAYEFSQYGSKPKTMTKYKEVFVGHTPVSSLRIPDVVDTPVNLFELWNLDTGGGWEGKLTIMNVDTKEYFQSDVVHTLYSEEHGRQGKQIRRSIKRRYGSMK